MNRAERLWSLRDGVLAWLYELRIEGTAIAEAKPAAFMEVASWSDTEVTREELSAALQWLIQEGYVDGTGTMQRIVLRPHLTPYGEKYAASGKSVRDLPGIAEVQSPYLHIEGSSGVAIAVNSHGAIQTVNVERAIKQARNLADEIEQALPTVTDAEVRAHAEDLVSAIRGESNAASPSPGRFKTLATTAMTAIATAAGTEAGKAIIEAALPLVS
ncbi:hypothetical protein [Mycolicibacterium iranicum]|uniref:Uncharacterized protein n=1 Tax=Mycolicibacterium iranicum TaxID=912594 RepID=A0A1X1WMY2_MYCIR|nr:hypothetical protein [Mycolicibacterium iranicum]ORV87903.1 hypothetical protein AWC12_16360 [Mycolicibacterium iranicum]